MNNASATHRSRNTSTPADLLDELQETLAHGTITRRVESLRCVTDLFVARAVDYSDEQVGLFDDVFLLLIEKIETSARATLAERLAPVPEAPPRIVRTLAFDDAIEVAGPLLSQSQRLDDVTLIENAKAKSQEHMLAISQRSTLSGSVTDVLVELGNRDVLRSTAENPGAEFSDSGFTKMIDRSKDDDDVATIIGMRPSITRPQFINLLARASNHVRAKLEAERVEPQEDIPAAVDRAATEMQNVSAELTPAMINAKNLVRELREHHALDEQHVIAFARQHRFNEVNASLASLAGVAISTVEIMMTESRSEGVLVLSKIIGLNWPAVSAILEMRQDLLDSKTIDLSFCKVGYERLKISTAQQVLRFHRMRQLT
jgi:uncharacterized protein (DUF2336 family)